MGKPPDQPPEADKSTDHILEHHDNASRNCLIKSPLQGIQPDFTLIAIAVVVASSYAENRKDISASVMLPRDE